MCDVLAELSGSDGYCVVVNMSDEVEVSKSGEAVVDGYSVDVISSGCLCEADGVCVSECAV